MVTACVEAGNCALLSYQFCFLIPHVMYHMYVLYLLILYAYVVHHAFSGYKDPVISGNNAMNSNITAINSYNNL